MMRPTAAKVSGTSTCVKAVGHHGARPSLRLTVRSSRNLAFPSVATRAASVR